MRSLFLSVTVALAGSVAAAAPQRAAPGPASDAVAPEIVSVEPTQALLGEEVVFTITGNGIAADASAALLDGGPYTLAGTQLSGYETTLARIDEQHVAIGVDREVEILDISDLHDPVVVGRHGLGYFPRRIAADDGLLVVAGSSGGDPVRVFDVSTPSAPVLKASVIPPAAVSRLVLRDDLLFVGSARFFFFFCLGGGLDIVSLADPANPVPLGSVPLKCVVEVRVRDRMAHVLLQADTAPRMRLINLDVSNPAAPAELGRLEWPNSDAFDRTGLAVEDEIAYVLQEYPGSLRTVDLRDPAAPSVIAETRLFPGSFSNTAAGRGGLFVSTDGVTLVDVHDPRNASPAAKEHAAGVRDFFLDGDLVHVTAPAGPGYGVLDFSVRRRPQTLRTFPGLAGGVEYVTDGSLVYAADYGPGPGVRVFDLTDPDAPIEIGHALDNAFVNHVALDGDRLWAGQASTALWLLDVADPTDPRPIGSVSGISARGIVASHGLAFVADLAGADMLRVFDPSDPTAIAEIGRWAIPRRPRHLGISPDGNILYLLMTNGSRPESLTLQAIDVSDPGAPFARGRQSWLGAASHFDVDGDVLWVADESGLLRIDFADPDFPRARFVLPAAGLDSARRLAGPYVFLFAGSASRYRRQALIVDVTDPLAPRLHQEIPLQELAFDPINIGDTVLFNRPGMPTIARAPAVELRAVDPNTWSLRVPPGNRAPGAYDVYVDNGDGMTARVRNAVRLCEPRELRAELVPADGSRPRRFVPPERWRVSVADGAELMADAARVALPPLSDDVAVTWAASADPETIELTRFADGRARVRLMGPAEQPLRDAWAAATAAGGFELTVNADGSFGDVLVDLPGRAPAAPSGGTQRYVYHLRDGMLDSVIGRGAGAGVDFTVSATDPFACRFAATARAGNGLRHPGED